MLNILFICNKSPWPPKEGGPIAMNQLITGLQRAGNHVKVLAADSAKYHVEPSSVPEEYRQKTGIEFVPLDLSVKPVPAFLNLFTRKSYHVQRFISGAFEKRLINILQNGDFDIVQLETLFMAPYIGVIRKYSRAKVVLRAHNIEHLIWKRMAFASRNPLKKFYLRHLYVTLERYEKRVLDQFDGILPITGKDAAFFRHYSQKPVVTIPFGVDTEQVPGQASLSVENALFHIGAMNWLPNEEGIRWLLKNVWPKLTTRFPEMKLYLAGRAMPPWLLRLHEKNVVVVGEVEDARDFMASKSISIAPLFSGSGVRIKILESMSLAKAVVATHTGAEGISCADGKDILIADTADAFADAIARLYKNQEEARRIGKNARHLIETKHDNTKIIARLEAFYDEIL